MRTLAFIKLWLARGLYLLHLICIFNVTCKLWTQSGARKAFTTTKNVHINDLQLAVELGQEQIEERKDSPEGNEYQHVALLFMLRDRLEHADVWEAWLQEVQGSGFSLYFHLANGDAVANSTKESLMSLPGARQIVPTVATGWCELMAAEVALYRAALVDDIAAQIFVLLPHDAVPLAPAGLAYTTLLSSGQVGYQSRFCLAGVRGMDVPKTCPHAIEPHWSRSLLLKHHQWTALSRKHAEKMIDKKALETAMEVYQEWFLGEPLCSDEVLPLLVLAVAVGGLTNTRLVDLKLYHGATWGLQAFENVLRDMGIASECITYAPWPGCRGVEDKSLDKRAKNPLVGGGLLPNERDELMAGLLSSGVLFCRKLGLGGDASALPSAKQHLQFIKSVTQGKPRLPPAPPRLLPQALKIELANLKRWVLFGLSSIDSAIPILFHTSLTMISIVAGWLSVKGGGISVNILKILTPAVVVAIFVAFFFSIVLHPEYSLLQPLRTVGLLTKVEL